MIAILFERFCFLKQHYYLLLSSIPRIYNPALKIFKIYVSTAVDSNNDEDEMDYLSASGGDADWWFFGETTNWIKISLNYIIGLN